jgi:HAD superfamily hydrolase (TIGR01509 family)
MSSGPPSRTPTATLRAILFDVDGVVTQTASVHAAAWKEMFDAFLATRALATGEVVTPFEVDDYLHYVDGRARPDGVDGFLESRGIHLELGTPADDPTLDTVWGLGNRKNEVFVAGVRRDGVAPYLSTVKLIRRLRELGIPTAAVSASENAASMLHSAGVDMLFDATIDGVDARTLGLAGKPDPALFLEASRQLGVPPEATAVVEDAVAGVEAGRNGGFGLVVGVNRAGLPDDLRRHGADIVVPDLSWFDIDDQGHWLTRDPDDTSPPSGFSLDEDPRWTLVVDEGSRRRVWDALLSLSDGRFGSRGEGDGDEPAVGPSVYAAGVYTTATTSPQLLEGPLWNRLEIAGPRSTHRRRILDLRTGVVTILEALGGGELRSVWFNCVTRPGCMVVRAEGPAGVFAPAPPIGLPPPVDAMTTTTGSDNTEMRAWASVTGPSGGGITAAGWQRRASVPDDDTVESLERIVAYIADARRCPSSQSALDALDDASAAGFDRLLSEHRGAWKERWADAEVSVDGDSEIEFAVRYASFELLASVADSGEAPVGARGLSGPAYGGHVFWDADAFVLPALAAMNPRAARAMLEYRIRRLGAARRFAAERGFAGARFPWESALDGDDVTPRSFQGNDGTTIAIRTGELEEHIVADVAWAACHYSQWTGDTGFLRGPGRPLVTETAEYWASRVRHDASGSAHIDGVIGPDEYHEEVDDNAFTNVMARWNLRAGADLIDPTGADRCGPAVEWRAIADALVDGFDPTTRRYEQFAGFSKLEPLLISEVASPPVAADLLLGHERVAQAQVLKQADVLMLHHLVPHEVVAGSLDANLDYYLPRTAHGSSLSPAIHASLLARAGKVEQARDMLLLAGRVDLDDFTGMTGGGLHLATMGGVWQAIVFGFAGVRVNHGVLHLDPHLPDAWERLNVHFRVLGRRVNLDIGHDDIEVHTDGALCVGFAEMVIDHLTPPAARYVRHANHWQRRPT